MEHIASFLMIATLCRSALTLPINNGLSVKFNSISSKEDTKSPKIFGALFAKIPQELPQEAALRRTILSNAYFAHSSALGTGCSNQIAKILFPLKGFEVNNDTQFIDNKNIVNLPIIKQPFDDYKILVATAPPNVKISGPDAKTMVIYVVFPNDGISDSEPINMPTIYFVNRLNGKIDVNKNEKVDPILVIDSNRTVTGLKSKEVARFLKFKNKLTNRYNYQLAR